MQDTPWTLHVGSGYETDDGGAIRTYAVSTDLGATLEQDLRVPPHPTFLAVSPDRAMLYANIESSSTAALALTRQPDDGTLTLVDSRTTGERIGAYVATAHGHLLQANYGSHSVTAIPVDGKGRLNDSWTRVPMPEGGFPHSVVPHPILPDLYVANRTANCIVRLTSADGTIRRDGSAAVVPDTARGVRHLVVDPTGTRMFSTDEESSTVTAYRLDADGVVHPIGSVRTVPDGWPDPNYPADLALDPGRQLLFVANRGHDSVAVFDVADGLPRPAGHLPVGRGPRNLSLDPEGDLLAVAVLRDDVVLLARVGDSGLDLDPRPVPVPTPSGLLLVPTGRLS